MGILFPNHQTLVFKFIYDFLMPKILLTDDKLTEIQNIYIHYETEIDHFIKSLY